MYQIDKIDQKIVDLLMRDGRMSSAKISRILGDISERVIRYRIQRMTDEGLIKISAIPDPKSFGFNVVADVFIEVETGQIDAVAGQLMAYEQISYIACSIGEKDISAQIVTRSTHEVFEFVTNVIGKIPGVRKTTTSIVPIVLKDVYEWRIPDSIVKG